MARSVLTRVGDGLSFGRARPGRAAVEGRPGLLLLVPVSAGVVFLLLPLLALASRSLSDQGLSGIVEMLGNDLFREAVQRTLVLALIVTAACVVIGSAYALAITASPRGLARWLLVVLFSTFWISILVRTFGWVLLLQPNGALDQLLRQLGLREAPLDVLQTYPAMFPAMVHVMLPFMILPVYAASVRLDPQLLRAAQSLGARPWSVLRHVVVPHLRPAILAGASIVFMLSLAFYVTPALLGGPDDLTVSTLIAREFTQAFDLGSAATMAMLLLVAIMALYLVIDRFVELIPTGSKAS